MINLGRYGDQGIKDEKTLAYIRDHYFHNLSMNTYSVISLEVRDNIQSVLSFDDLDSLRFTTKASIYASSVRVYDY